MSETNCVPVAMPLSVTVFPALPVAPVYTLNVVGTSMIGLLPLTSGAAVSDVPAPPLPTAAFVKPTSPGSTPPAERPTDTAAAPPAPPLPPGRRPKPGGPCRPRARGRAPRTPGRGSSPSQGYTPYKGRVGW